jgi:hypothetical protein
MRRVANNLELMGQQWFDPFFSGWVAGWYDHLSSFQQVRVNR